MNKRFLKKDIDNFELLSKITNAYVLVNHIIKLGFNNYKLGASAMVFINNNTEYVIKIGDNMDMIPRTTSRFHKYYAKVLWRSKNKKMVVQEKVNTCHLQSKKAIKLISEKFDLDIYDLDEKYDISIYNVGMRNNKPKIIDYRNYNSKYSEYFASTPYWYGFNLEGRRFKRK